MKTQRLESCVLCGRPSPTAFSKDHSGMCRWCNNPKRFDRLARLEKQRQRAMDLGWEQYMHTPDELVRL